MITPRASSFFTTPNANPNKMDKGVIEGYYHHMPIMVNVNWDETKKSIVKKGTFLYIYLYFKILNSLSKCKHHKIK